VLKIAEQYVKFEMPRGDEILAAMTKGAIASNNYRAAIDRKAVQAGLDMLVATKLITKALPLSELIYDKAP